MELQSNPYLIWQLVPGIILLGIGLYIQSRPVKKRESNVFSLLMFGGSLWTFTNAVQWVSPDPGWQKVWYRFTYLGIMIIPTAWFLLSVKLTGMGQKNIEKVERWLWFVPALLYISLLFNDSHRLFFKSLDIINLGGFAALEADFGPFFYVHTGYSYILMVAGIVILGAFLIINFKRYGAQAYGLIVGVLAPLVGNAYYIFGSPPPGFPDPTPVIFTVTGVAFAWAIFSGRILEVVPLAHDDIVQKLSTGIVILDLEKNIRDINRAAIDILEAPGKDYLGHPFANLVNGNSSLGETFRVAFDNDSERRLSFQVTMTKSGRVFDVLVSRVEDKNGHLTGRLLQFSDVSEKIQAEVNLLTVQETLESLMNSLQDSYFEADPAGVITYANSAFANALGFPQEEVTGKHFRHFTQRKDIRDIFQKFHQVIETKTSLEPFRFDYRAKDGRIYMAETTVSPIIENGSVVGTRGMMRDITDRVLADEALRQTKEEAEARAEELAAINRIAMIVNQSLNLNDILQALCQELTQIFPIRNAGIGLLSADQESLEIVAFHSINSSEVSALGMVLPFEGNASSQEVIEKKRTVVIQDSQTDPRTRSLADISRTRGTKSILIVPLLTRGNAIGTIGMPARDPEHVFTENEVKLAETIASQIAAAIDNARLYARTESALDVAERDLEIGRQIQAGFFPEQLPDVPGWEIVAHFEAARQVAGDFYDVFRFRNSRFIALVIADVCDKGVGAALFMVLFRSLLRAFSETEINDHNVREQLLKIILNTNNFIAEYHGKSNMFATLFFGILDPNTGNLYYVNGGHEPPVILDKEGRIMHRLMPTGPAVGMFPDLEFRVEKVQFECGDGLLGFTDGTTDAKNGVGELFTEERLLENIASPWTSVFSMVFELKTALKNHIGQQHQFDDITLLSFRRKLAQDDGHHAICRVARMDHLGELRAFAEDAARQDGLAHNDAFAFKLAAEEICANIIQYGFEGGEPGFISLAFESEGNKAWLKIKDDGKYFSPDQAAVPNIEADWDERDIGGLGMFFVKELMDHVTYQKMDGNVNLLVLEKDVKRSV